MHATMALNILILDDVHPAGGHTNSKSNGVQALKFWTIVISQTMEVLMDTPISEKKIFKIGSEVWKKLPVFVDKNRRPSL